MVFRTACSISLALLSLVVGGVASAATDAQCDAAYRAWFLERSAASGDDIGTRYLLSRGADPNGSDAFRDRCVGGIEPSRPLVLASMNGHLNVVKLLLAAGANPDFGDGDRSTPLSVAVAGGKTTIVRLLLLAGASPSHPDEDLVASATSRGFSEIAGLLKQAKLAPNKPLHPTPSAAEAPASGAGERRR